MLNENILFYINVNYERDIRTKKNPNRNYRDFLLFRICENDMY